MDEQNNKEVVLPEENSVCRPIGLDIPGANSEFYQQYDAVALSEGQKQENIICRTIGFDLPGANCQQYDPVALSEGVNKNITSDCSIKSEDVILPTVDSSDEDGDKHKVEACMKKSVNSVESVDEKLKISQEIEETKEISTDFVDNKSSMSPEETKTDVPADEEAVESPKVEMESGPILDDVEEKPEVEPVMPENRVDENLKILDETLEIIEKLEVPEEISMITDFIDRESAFSSEVEATEENQDDKNSETLDDLQKVEEKVEAPTISMDVATNFIDKEPAFLSEVEAKEENQDDKNSESLEDLQKVEEKMEVPAIGLDVTTDVIDKEPAISLEVEEKKENQNDENSEILEDLQKVEEKMEVPAISMDVTTDLVDEEPAISPEVETTTSVAAAEEVVESPEVETKSADSPTIKTTPEIKERIFKSPPKPKRRSTVEIKSYESNESPEGEKRSSNVLSLIRQFENWTKLDKINE